MSKTAKSGDVSTNGTASRHTITIPFTTAEDITLYNYLVEQAKADRRPVALYALLTLHGATELGVQGPADE